MKGKVGNISLKNININTQSPISGLFIGTTQSDKWNLCEKENLAMGSIASNKKEETLSINNINLIIDGDFFDNSYWKL